MCCKSATSVFLGRNGTISYSRYFTHDISLLRMNKAFSLISESAIARIHSKVHVIEDDQFKHEFMSRAVI